MPDRILLKLTALTPVAHGEAGANSTGPNNTTLFNRQLQRLTKETVGVDVLVARDAIANLLTASPIGADTFPLLESLKGSELVAALFVAQVPIMFPGDGEGLFTGMERYRMLSTRLADGAKCCATLPELWSYLSRKLMLPMFPSYGFGPSGIRRSSQRNERKKQSGQKESGVRATVKQLFHIGTLTKVGICANPPTQVV